MTTGKSMADVPPIPEASTAVLDGRRHAAAEVIS